MAVAFRFSRSWASMNSRQGSHREVATGPGAGGQGGNLGGHQGIDQFNFVSPDGGL